MTTLTQHLLARQLLLSHRPAFADCAGFMHDATLQGRLRLAVSRLVMSQCECIYVHSL